MYSEEVIRFWFEECDADQWFTKNAAFDAEIAQRFGEAHRQAADGELWRWRDTALGRLAEIIILDQFSRNIHRDRPEAFACDAVALALAQEAVREGADRGFSPEQKAFLYMPYMHSESLVIHAEAVRLYAQPGLEANLDFEYRHKEIIDRFGRYPHRNAVLGRVSTAEEIAFLEQPGSGF